MQSVTHEGVLRGRSGESWRRRFADWPLQTKIFISFCFIGILPLLVLGISLGKTSSDALESQTLHLSHRLAVQIARTIESNVRDMERLSLTPYADQNIQAILRNQQYLQEINRMADRREVDRMIFTMLSLRPDIVGIYLWADNGETYAKTSRFESVSPETLRNQPWFEEARHLDGTMLTGSGIRWDGKGNAPLRVVWLARLVKDVDYYRPLGVILIDANLSMIANICQEARATPSGQIIVLDAEGSVLYRTDEEHPDAYGLDPTIATLKGLDSTLKITAEGKAFALASAQSSYTGWTVISVVPSNELDQAGPVIRLVTILLLVFCLAGSVSAAYLISRSITGPIRTLTEHMRMAEAGDFQSLEARSTDEIGELTRSFSRMISRIDELINSVYQAELKRKEAELHVLQGQMNPHFIYNTLESIRGMALEAGAKNVVDITKAFGMLMRYNLGDAGQKVPLADEIAYAKRYVEVMRMRRGEAFTVDFAIEDRYIGSPILRLTLQPLIENALLHGIEGQEGRIHIAAFERKGALELSVSDDGKGINEDRLLEIRAKLAAGKSSKSASIGLANVHARLGLAFGASYGLRIASEVGRGTTVIIRVPIKNGDAVCTLL